MPEPVTERECRQILRASRESVDQLLGVFGQAEEIDAWAKEEGYEIVGHSLENAISGGTPLVARREWVRAYWDGLDGKHGGFVFVSQDRMGRDMEVIEQMRHACRWGGLKLISLELGRNIANDETATQRHDRHRRDWEAEDFLCKMSGAGLKARLAKRDRGGKPGGRPFHRKFGFEVAVIGHRLDYRAVPAEQAVIRRIRTACVGGRGYAAMARQLNVEGVPTVTGAKWSSKTVRDLVVQPGRVPRLEAVSTDDARPVALDWLTAADEAAL